MSSRLPITALVFALVATAIVLRNAGPAAAASTAAAQAVAAD